MRTTDTCATAPRLGTLFLAFLLVSCGKALPPPRSDVAPEHLAPGHPRTSAEDSASGAPGSPTATVPNATADFLSLMRGKLPALRKGSAIRAATSFTGGDTVLSPPTPTSTPSPTPTPTRTPTPITQVNVGAGWGVGDLAIAQDPYVDGCPASHETPTIEGLVDARDGGIAPLTLAFGSIEASFHAPYGITPYVRFNLTKILVSDPSAARLTTPVSLCLTNGVTSSAFFLSNGQYLTTPGDGTRIVYQRASDTLIRNNFNRGRWQREVFTRSDFTPRQFVLTSITPVRWDGVLEAASTIRFNHGSPGYVVSYASGDGTRTFRWQETSANGLPAWTMTTTEEGITTTHAITSYLGGMFRVVATTLAFGQSETTTYWHNLRTSPTSPHYFLASGSSATERRGWELSGAAGSWTLVPAIAAPGTLGPNLPPLAQRFPAEGTTLTVSGGQVTVTDSKGAARRFGYNAQGLLVTASGTEGITTMSYDPLFRTTGMTRTAPNGKRLLTSTVRYDPTYGTPFDFQLVDANGNRERLLATASDWGAISQRTHSLNGKVVESIAFKNNMSTPSGFPAITAEVVTEPLSALRSLTTHYTLAYAASGTVTIRNTDDGNALTVAVDSHDRPTSFTGSGGYLANSAGTFAWSSGVPTSERLTISPVGGTAMVFSSSLTPGLTGMSGGEAGPGGSESWTLSRGSLDGDVLTTTAARVDGSSVTVTRKAASPNAFSASYQASAPDGTRFSGAQSCALPEGAISQESLVCSGSASENDAPVLWSQSTESGS